MAEGAEDRAALGFLLRSPALGFAAMSAGAAVAAAAMRERQKQEQDRKRSRVANMRKEADEARKAMSSGPMDFAKAVAALKAQRKMEEAAAEKRRPTLLALSDSSYPIEVVGPSGKVYCSTSIFCLRPYHCPRNLAIWTCESRPFDPLILVTIMCNCATMAWESPLDPCCTPKADFIDVSAAAAATAAARAAHGTSALLRCSHARDKNERACLLPPLFIRRLHP